MDTTSQDEQEIRRLHNVWFRANEGLHVDQMQTVMAGEAFHHFNLNGYTYNGLSELSKLWDGMAQVFDLKKLQNDADVRVVVSGDIGWLTVESEVVLDMIEESGSGDMKGDTPTVVMPFRITEIFKRDDGYGNQVWKMWHFHCSQRLTEGSRFPHE